ncbi:hypothetical protein PHYSODRAFT_288771 [Phytophthora sojae]|uniref:RxLR effector protein n=2 Tax=Phytophthora sojae TaxID=67593 RepID=G5A7N9_PHYSP|nr:hypothetical protein PHYSODRAFT_288771 [Phytophthora sojae]AEK81239.1 Avh355a1 [Phytophthora sojae]AEK81240.1 Avh355a1 [Phytophthora sojae]AEK81241.1 Avh355a1 [Phytophthora sojae]EGZ07915.1 hypothetical protein PHYSODRAFT_288771 [Phytophthora sojae]|eukprot:XP_009536087.1 hypothetical protein PHYSODRAFT_288771 [Phytophthora sojae]
MVLPSVVRLCRIALVALIVLLAFVNALPVAAHSKRLGVSPRASLDFKSGYEQTKRHLRTHKKSREDEARPLMLTSPSSRSLPKKCRRNQRLRMKRFNPSPK